MGKDDGGGIGKGNYILSKGLFDKKEFTAVVGEPWMKSDTDKMLDLYFGGATPAHIAIQLNRNVNAITVRLGKFTYNVENKADTYEPLRRNSRRGKRITQNEQVVIKGHQMHNVSPAVTARVLQREVKEFHTAPGVEERTEVRIASKLPSVDGFMVDLVLAHQYLFYCAKAPVISESDFESLRAEEKEYGKGSQALSKPPSDKATDYPPHVRSLAYYLQVKKMQSTGVWNFRVIPYGFVCELADTGCKLAKAWLAEIGNGPVKCPQCSCKMVSGICQNYGCEGKYK